MVPFEPFDSEIDCDDARDEDEAERLGDPEATLTPGDDREPPQEPREQQPEHAAGRADGRIDAARQQREHAAPRDSTLELGGPFPAARLPPAQMQVIPLRRGRCLDPVRFDRPERYKTKIQRPTTIVSAIKAPRDANTRRPQDMIAKATARMGVVRRQSRPRAKRPSSSATPKTIGRLP